MAVNKVVYGGTTLIDLTSDTVTAETLLKGRTAHKADGSIITGTYEESGSGSAIVVTEEQDSHGGTIKIITAVDLSEDTVTAATLLQGVTAHDKNGNALTGTYVPSSGADTSDATMTSGGQMLQGVTAYAKGTKYTGTIPSKSAATITPTKSTQTIASGQYLSGTQTIAPIPAAYQDVTGVTAAAGDVVSGKDIVDSSGTVVHGSLVVQSIYSGSSAPSSSTGANGDIYIQTGA